MPELYPLISLKALLPEIVLVLAGCALLLFDRPRGAPRGPAAWITLAAIVLAIVVDWFSGGQGAAAGSGLVHDGTAHFVRVAALIMGVLLTLVAWFQPVADEQNEFFAMMLFSLAGLLLVGAASDLVVLFLALELLSIPTYVMVVLSRTRAPALEAGTKYFYLGAMAAAVTAYGFSLLYGVGGSANLAQVIGRVSSALAQPEEVLPYSLAVLGLLLSLGGLFFKIAAVPLHFYIADVYQGAASPVAGLLGFVPKLAGFVAIMRIVGLTEWQTLQGGLFWLLWIAAVLSMTVGNVLALWQTNIKRMLAYSGIAHSGYMLVGILAGPPRGDGGFLGDGVAAVLYYVVIYGIANLGAFAVLNLLRVRGEPCEELRDVAGLIRRQMGPALLLVLAMFTLMGLPPTPGFWGKLSLFGGALAVADAAPAATQWWIYALVVLGVLNSAMAAAYYLRVIAACLVYESDEPVEAVTRDAPQIGAALCGFLTLIFAFYPTVLLNAGRAASPRMAAVPPPAVQVADAPRK